MGGSSLTVVPGKAKIPRASRPYDTWRFCLSDIPDGVTDEYLTLFIDGRTYNDETPEILYGERPGTALVTFPTPIQGIMKL